jgi:hypothetical protein
MSSTALASWRRIGASLLITAAGFAAATACSSRDDGNGLAGLNPTGSGANSSSATGSGSTGSGASGGTINVGAGGSDGSGATSAGGSAGSGTAATTCVRIGMFGRPPSYGATQNGPDNTDALQSWLNTHVKAGTTVDVVTTQTPITTDLLGKYDVIILQALEKQEGGPYWTFTADELATFEAWLRAGGGVIALTGYGQLSAEVNPTNQLLAFTGMSFNMDDIFGTCPDNCCYCAGGSIPVGGWQPAHPIAANITAVGAFHGRSVNAADGSIVATDGTTVYGATKNLDAGRIFFFFDEWVTYSSQWATGGTFVPDASCSDPNNVCNGRTPAADYQVPQFWYNALKWASGGVSCFDFTPDVTVVR